MTSKNITKREQAPCQTSHIHTYLLLKALWCEVKVIQRNKVVFQKPHQQHQVDTVCELDTRRTLNCAIRHGSENSYPSSLKSKAEKSTMGIILLLLNYI